MRDTVIEQSVNGKPTRVKGYYTYNVFTGRDAGETPPYAKVGGRGAAGGPARAILHDRVPAPHP